MCSPTTTKGSDPSPKACKCHSGECAQGKRREEKQEKTEEGIRGTDEDGGGKLGVTEESFLCQKTLFALP